MRLDKKEWILLAIAAFPSFAGLAIADPWVFFPCFSISWVATVLLCILHEGRRWIRTLFGLVLTIVFSLIGWRSYESVKENESLLRALLHPTSTATQPIIGAERKPPEQPSPMSDLESTIKSNLEKVTALSSRLQKELASPSPLPSPATLTPHEIVETVKQAYPAFREETAKDYKGADVDWNLLFDSASTSSQLKNALKVFFVEEKQIGR